MKKTFRTWFYEKTEVWEALKGPAELEMDQISSISFQILVWLDLQQKIYDYIFVFKHKVRYSVICQISLHNFSPGILYHFETSLPRAQKYKATLNSTDTLGLVSSGQFLLKKDPCGLAKNFPLEYWWNIKTSLVSWNG